MEGRVPTEREFERLEEATTITSSLVGELTTRLISIMSVKLAEVAPGATEPDAESPIVERIHKVSSVVVDTNSSLREILDRLTI